MQHDWGSVPGRGSEGILLFPTASKPALGSIRSPVQCVPWALSQGLKRPGHEADHTSQTSAEVKRMRAAVLPLTQYVFTAWLLSKMILQEKYENRDEVKNSRDSSVGIATRLDDRGSIPNSVHIE